MSRSVASTSATMISSSSSSAAMETSSRQEVTRSAPPEQQVGGNADGYNRTHLPILNQHNLQGSLSDINYLAQIAEARAAGQARKEEAIRRREEFVMKQSEAKLVSSKSVQQLNAEREEMIAREVAKIQVGFTLQGDSGGLRHGLG